MINKQILVTSINKSIEESKIYGQLDLTILYFFNLLMYYIDYTNGHEIFENENKQLKLLIQNLKYKYPDIICNYKLIDGSTAELGLLPPTVASKQVDLNGEYFYTFSYSDFLENYNDPKNNLYNKIFLIPTKLNKGILLYNGIEVKKPIEITIPDLSNQSKEILDLQYAIPSDNDFNPFEARDINKQEVNTLFEFKVSNTRNLYSTTESIDITNSVYMPNYPAQIGDIFITSENRTETILSLQTFTNLMTPPYSDPENDLIDAIRIDSISTSNQGIFTINGLEAQEGDIITKAQLEAGELKHIGPNTDSIATDSMEFSARDTGSLIWVQ